MSRLVDGLILLAATALVSGLLVPFIVNRIQIANQQRLKRYETDLARQTKVIEDQGTLIQRISSLLWEFQLTLLAPIYYGQPGFQILQPIKAQGPESPDSLEAEASVYEKAAKNYLASAPRLLSSIRAEIGGAVRLVPADQWNTLRELYYDELLQLDLLVTKIIHEGLTPENENERSKAISYIRDDFAEKLDRTVDGLASALDLKYRTP